MIQDGIYMTTILSHPRIQADQDEVSRIFCFITRSMLKVATFFCLFKINFITASKAKINFEMPIETTDEIKEAILLESREFDENILKAKKDM